MMNNAYIPLTTPEGRTLFMPQSALAFGVYADTMVATAPIVLAPAQYQQVNIAPVSLPEYVEEFAQQEILTQEDTQTFEMEGSEEEDASDREEIFEEEEPEEQDTETMTVEVFKQELIEEVISEMQAPAMTKAKTIEHEDEIDDSDAMSVCSSSASVTQEEEVAGEKIEVSIAPQPYLHEKVEEDKEEMVTAKLPLYVTKKALRIRSGPTKNAEEVGQLKANQRVFLLENGIEEYSSAKVCQWWLNTFNDMEDVVKNIHRFNLDGRQMMEFTSNTIAKLGLYTEEVEKVKKALTLVSRKSQIVYFVEAEARRGWVSKVKGGKSTMARVFTNVTPQIVIHRLEDRKVKPGQRYQKYRNFGGLVCEAETRMNNTFEALDLEYNAVKFGTYFDESPRGRDRINKRGRRVRGTWKPANHCLIEFASHAECARALRKLAAHSSYPGNFKSQRGFSLFEKKLFSVEFSSEYANLTSITYPKF